MKISYNWLKEYLPESLKPEEIAAILTSIGLEVESLVSWYSAGNGLKGLIVGEVMQVLQHPNAERLRLTQVNTGGTELLTIVCGAPNVAQGQKVIVAPVGCTIYPLKGEPVTIGRSRIRGEWSEGMLCAADEVGLGDSHEGILVLPHDAAAGRPLKEYYQYEEDFLLEIGVTPNRSDALSHRGVARDIAAYLRKPYHKVLKLAPDELIHEITTSRQQGIEIVIEESSTCRRFSGVVLDTIRVEESPAWLITKLSAIGVRPINNVVDITNYILHDTGQPLHAYDFGKIRGGKIVAGTAPFEGLLRTLDGIERKLQPDDLVIKDQEGALGLAGVFGGFDSAITPSTRKIFLESACFDSVAVRRTARRHSLSTDASFRFERGTDPSLTLPALKMAVGLLEKYAQATVLGSYLDEYPEIIQPAVVKLRHTSLTRLIGAQIAAKEIESIIHALEIKIRDIVTDNSGDLTWQLEIPLYRTDVRREADVIEEILRIYGYNKIATPTQLRSSMPFEPDHTPAGIQESISGWLSARGMNEIINNSLISSSLLSDQGPEYLASAVTLLNPLSRDIDSMRQTMLYSGLKSIAFNHNRRLNDLRLYEYGKVYSKTSQGYEEKNMLALYYTGSLPEKWWHRNEPEQPYFELKGVVEALLWRVGVRTREIVRDNSVSPGSERPWLCSLLQWGQGSDEVLASMGSVDTKVLKTMEIDKPVWYAEFDWDQLLRVRNNTILASEISRYPSVTRDLSLKVTDSISYTYLKDLILKQGIEIVKNVSVIDVFRGEKIGEGVKSYTLRFHFEDTRHTLTDHEIDRIMALFTQAFATHAGAVVRSS